MRNKDCPENGVSEGGSHMEQLKDAFEPERFHLFAPVLKLFDVELVPLERPSCPVKFCTGIAKPKPGSGAAPPPHRRIAGGGQGHDSASAAVSCLGELAERLSLCSLGAQDPRVFEKQEAMPDLEVGNILGFSADQLRAMADTYPAIGEISGGIGSVWNELDHRRVQVVAKGKPAAAQIPANVALFDEPVARSGKLPKTASSIGCAVWPDFFGARKRAYQELLERDAVAQAWYNRLGITLLDKGAVRELIEEKIFHYLETCSRSWSVLAVDSEFDVHAMIAISCDEGGYWAAFGSAAGETASEAIEAALREMLQSENSLQMMKTAYSDQVQAGQAPRQVPMALQYAQQTSIVEDLALNELALAPEAALAKTYSFELLQDGLSERGITVWEFDATRPDFGIPCIKLFSPELCNWQPRFGKRRLYTGMVERGFRQAPATEAEFAARPFPF